MRIDGVEIFRISIPFHEPFRFGKVVVEGRDHIIVKVASERMVGWGEAAILPWPYYNSENVSGAYHLICELLAPLVVGQNYSRPQDLEGTFKLIHGNKIAQSAIDAALWDLFAQEKRETLASFLGATRDSVPVGVSLGKRKTEAEFVRAVEDAVRQGYTRVKVKISPGFPIEALYNVRSSYPYLQLSVDANGSFDEDSFDELRKYDALSLDMIEQPFYAKQMLLTAELQRAMKTDICLDESIEDLDDLKLAGSLKACRVVNIKPARVGGLSSALTIRSLSKELGLATWVGGLLETGIGRAVNLAFAATMAEAFPHDISECGTYCSEELIHGESRLLPGARLAVPSQRPGLGIEVNQEALEHYAVSRYRVDD